MNTSLASDAPPPGQPLTEATLTILLSLVPEPRHGYAILKAVPELSGGRVSLTTGTLYGALKRLLEQGWIERLDDPSVVATGRPQKVYMLTLLGRRILSAELQRLEALLAAARRRGALETP
jgi:DNA-binding PadR family transcriptional regulator